MTTDELIAKLLDGTISTAEQQQLQELAASSPALAEEIHRLTVIENLLAAGEEETEVATAVPFLRSVENGIAASIAAGSTVSAGSGNSIPRMFFAPLLVLLGGIGVFLAWPSSDEPATTRPEQFDTPPSLSMHIPAPEETVTPSGPVATEPVAAEPVETRQRTAQRARSVEENRTTPPAPEPEVPEVTTTRDGSALIRKSSSSNDAAAEQQFETLRASYEASLQQGDNVKAAIAAKSIGSFYRSRGDIQQAQTYLQTSLGLSRKASLPEYEAQALGELGLLARDTGDTTTARTYISSCIELLQKSGVTSSLQRWQKELTRLNN